MVKSTAIAYGIYRWLTENFASRAKYQEEEKLLKIYRNFFLSMDRRESDKMQESVGQSLASLEETIGRYCKGARWYSIGFKPLPKRSTIAVVIRSRDFVVWIAPKPKTLYRSPFMVAAIFNGNNRNGQYRQGIETRFLHGICGVYLPIRRENDYKENKTYEQGSNGLALFNAVGESEAFFGTDEYREPGLSDGSKESKPTDPRKAAARQWFANMEENGAETRCTTPTAVVKDMIYAPAASYNPAASHKLGDEFTRSKLCLALRAGEKLVVVNIRNEFHEYVGYVTEKRQEKLMATLTTSEVVLFNGADGLPTRASLKRWFTDAGLKIKK